MARKKPVRIGLIGLGRAGWGMHVPELKGKEKLFQIVAVCDPIAQRLKAALHSSKVRARPRLIWIV